MRQRTGVLLALSLTALSGIGFAISGGMGSVASAGENGRKTPVVVELFTSQG